MDKLKSANTFININIILEKADISEKMKVADLGCGSTGLFVFPISDLVGEEGAVYGVDIQRVIIENLNKKIKQENIRNIKVVWSNLEVFNATKIEASCLDIAFLINTLYQSNKRAAILREAIRMLKKEGRLVVIEWDNVRVPFGPPAESRVKADLLKEGAKKLGLKLEEEFIAGRFHYGLIFTKV